MRFEELYKRIVSLIKLANFNSSTVYLCRTKRRKLKKKKTKER